MRVRSEEKVIDRIIRVIDNFSPDRLVARRDSGGARAVSKERAVVEIFRGWLRQGMNEGCTANARRNEGRRAYRQYRLGLAPRMKKKVEESIFSLFFLTLSLPLEFRRQFFLVPRINAHHFTDVGALKPPPPYPLLPTGLLADRLTICKYSTFISQALQFFSYL